MIVVLVIAALVILAGVVVVARGGGGELATDRPPDPVASDFRSWHEVLAYRPPAALLGYDAVATEQALAQIARAVADRDAEIDLLRRRLAAAQSRAEWSLQPAAAERGLQPASEPGWRPEPGRLPGE